MKKIILLEDDLGTARKFAWQLRKWKEGNNRFEVSKVLFYEDDLEEDDLEGREDIKRLQDEGIEVEWVNIINFDRVMDRLYKDQDNIFIFDTYLLTDESSIFKYRINISYALNRISDKRIWLYTNAGQEIKDSINELFKDMVIDTRIEESEYTLLFRDNEEFVNCVRGE